jgi:hypothetical protein
MNNHQVYLPIRIKNAEKDQDRIFPEIKNIDLEGIQRMVSKPVIVFDIDQNILIQVSPNDIFKVGIDTDWEIISTLLHDLDLTIPGVIQNGDMVITAFGKTQRQLNQAFSNITNLFSTKTTSDLVEGSNQYFTQARARTAAVQNSINPSETQRAPSQRAVHLALESLRVSLEDLLSLESTARISDVQDLIELISSVLNSLNNGIQNRINGDQILADSIQDEAQQRINSINSLITDIANLNSLLNSLIFDEISNRTNADDDLQSQIDAVLSSLSLGIAHVQSQLDNEIANRETGDLTLNDRITDAQDRIAELQEQIDLLSIKFEGILSDDNTFIFTIQDEFILVPGLEVEVGRGRYYVEYHYYGRSSANGRTHTHRITVNDTFIPGSDDGYLIRSNQFQNHFYKQIVNVDGSGILRIEARRSGGNGNYEAYEKRLLIRRIGDI